MNKRLTVRAHLSLADLRFRYREAKDPVARSHWHIIWLLAQGKTTAETAEATGYRPAWIRTIAHRYNREGPQGLGDRRHSNPGGRFILSPEQQAWLKQALGAPPPGGGLWTGAKVARWILEQTGRRVYPQRGWEYLKRLAPQHGSGPHLARAKPPAQDAVKKRPNGKLRSSD